MYNEHTSGDYMNQFSPMTYLTGCVSDFEDNDFHAMNTYTGCRAIAPLIN
jgi:hypothetical protein